MGNELWGNFQIGWQTPEGNAQRYRAFYRAILHLVPPDTKIIANGADADVFKDWNGALIKQAGSELSYVSTHFVVSVDDLVSKDADQDTRCGMTLALPVGMARALESLRAQVDSDPATRGRVKFAFTEWMFHAGDRSLPNSSNLGGAIIGAGWMNMLLSHADFVPISKHDGPGGRPNRS